VNALYTWGTSKVKSSCITIKSFLEDPNEHQKLLTIIGRVFGGYKVEIEDIRVFGRVCMVVGCDCDCELGSQIAYALGIHGGLLPKNATEVNYIPFQGRGLYFNSDSGGLDLFGYLPFLRFFLRIKM